MTSPKRKPKPKHTPGQTVDYTKRASCPEDVKNLLVMHNKDLPSAASAIGVSPQSLRNLANGDAKHSTYMKSRIEAGLRGETLPPSNMRGPKKAHGPVVVAVVVAKVEVFEKLHAVWQTMGNQWAYQRKAGTYWVGVVKAFQRDIEAFTALAKAYNADVIAP